MFVGDHNKCPLYVPIQFDVRPGLLGTVFNRYADLWITALVIFVGTVGLTERTKGGKKIEKNLIIITVLNYYLYHKNLMAADSAQKLGDLLDALGCRYGGNAQYACVAYTVTRSDRRFGVEAQHAHLAHVPVTVAYPHVSLVQRGRCTRKLQASPGLSYGHWADEVSIRPPVRG